MGLLLLILLSAPSPTTLAFSTDGSCGDEQSIRDAITIRLGRDPFRDGTLGPRFVATITRDGPGWASNLSVDGGLARRRTSAECRELTQSLALAIALVLELVPKPEPAPQAPVEAPPPTVSFDLAASAFASAGLSPHVTAGVGLAGGLRSGRFLLGLEARFDVPASIAQGGVTFRSFPVLVTLSPGFSAGIVRLSAPLSAGALFVTGSTSGSSVVASAGLQVGLGFELSGSWSIEPFVRAQVAFVNVTVLSGPAPVWTTWPISGLAGVGVRSEFR
jgi:hypothetical protein